MSGQKANIITVEDIRVVQKFFTKNWFLLVLVPAFFALVAYFYTHRLPEIYGARTEILLKSGEELDYQSQVYTSLAGFYSNYADITNQKRVLTSYDLVSKVLEKLDYSVTYYVVGRVKTIPGNSLEPVDMDIDVHWRGLYGQRIDFRILDDDRYELSFELNEGRVTREHHFDANELTDEYSILVKKKDGFYDIPIDELIRNKYQVEINDLNSQVNAYRSNMKVDNVEYTSVLSVTLENELVDRAKMFLDTLAKVYIDYTLEKQIQLNENTIDYIDVQLDALQGTLDSIETEMEFYKASNAILDLGKEEEQLFRELVKYESQKEEIELKVEALNSLQNYLLTSGEEKLLPPSSFIVQDRFLDASLNELYSMQLEMDRDLMDLTDENLGIQFFEGRMDSLRNNLIVYINNSRVAYEDRIGDLDRLIRTYELKIRTIPGSQRDIVEINRKLKVNEKMYTFLLEKRANTVIAKAAIIPQTSIIEKARGIGLVAPDKERIILTFIGAGMLLAAFIAFLRFMFFERIENTRELKEATHI
ncbi:MAG: hypothetical protein HKN79_02375, partial [Flavobacteriales bacterium]|nr:hypothetical protein [Flavobacteriales bacterium]